MKNLISSVIFASLMTAGITLGGTAYANKVSDYNAAVALLSKGKSLKAIVNFDQCQSTPANMLKGMAIVRLPDVVYIRDNKIIVKQDISIGDSEFFPELGNFKQSIKVTITSDNQMLATLRVLDPIQYTDKLPPINVHCTFGQGFDLYTA